MALPILQMSLHMHQAANLQERQVPQDQACCSASSFHKFAAHRGCKRVLSCNPWSAPTIFMVCRLLKELLDDGKPAADVDEDEVTWETVQEVFDRVQDRSWQLLADDLTVCIRTDGSDWILGAGGFGRVCSCLSVCLGTHATF